MNDIAFHCRYEVAAAGGLSRCNVSALNHRLRRALNNHGGYAYPIERVAQRLDARAWSGRRDGSVGLGQRRRRLKEGIPANVPFPAIV